MAEKRSSDASTNTPAFVVEVVSLLYMRMIAYNHNPTDCMAQYTSVAEQTAHSWRYYAT